MTTPTTPTAKQQVLDWVRSKNPQTMELKFGCKVEKIAGAACDFRVIGQDKDFVQVYNFWKQEVLGALKPSEIEWIWKEKGGNKDIVTFDEMFTILGSDMGLDCFARAFKEHFPDARIEWDKEYPHYMYFFSGRDSAEFVAYDLRKENLHDQDDKFFVQLNTFLIRLPLSQ